MNLQDVYYRTDLEGKIVNMSPSVEGFLGIKPEQLFGKPMSDFYAPPYSREKFLEQLQSNQGKVTNYEIKIQDLEGKIRWIETNSQYFFQNNQLAGIEGTLREITDKKIKRQKMLTLAFEDPLTGLPNRRALISSLEKALFNAQRLEHKGGILFIDLDNFKPINDTYGHTIGDKLLQLIAKRLEEVFKAEDSVFRFGGDEFIALAPLFDKNESQANQALQTLSEKVLETIKQPYMIDQLSLRVSASLGLVTFPKDGFDADQLIAQADEAMYQAKKESKNHRTS